MFTTQELPTDIYGRYINLGTALIEAVATAERSSDNEEMFIKFINSAANVLGYTVEKSKAGSKKTPSKSTT
jgi:hypothetical protein